MTNSIQLPKRTQNFHCRHQARGFGAQAAGAQAEESEASVASEFDFIEFNLPEPFLTMHPVGVRQRAIKSGDTVRCRMKVSESICPGVASMPKGAQRKASHNGQTARALTLDTVNFVGAVESSNKNF